MAEFVIFPDPDRLAAAVEDLLRETFIQPAATPFGVMLAGGATPLPSYRRLAARAWPPVPQLHLMFTDDRHVPALSTDSNYGNALPLIRALRPRAVLRVNSELPLTAAAARYADDLRQFFDRGGGVRLALLGLGTDGHTCSLFTTEAASRRDALAFAVPGAGGFDRVTVSCAVLEEAMRVVILAAGSSKTSILQRLRDQPLLTPAGVAVRNCGQVEVWTDVQLPLRT